MAGKIPAPPPLLLVGSVSISAFLPLCCMYVICDPVTVRMNEAKIPKSPSPPSPFWKISDRLRNLNLISASKERTNERTNERETEKERERDLTSRRARRLLE